MTDTGALADRLEKFGPAALITRAEIKMIVAALRASAPPAQRETGREEVIEECAKVLDEAAQDWRRVRDPGMANNAASYAKKIRAFGAKP